MSRSKKIDYLREVYVESLQKYISKIYVIDVLAKLNEHYKKCRYENKHYRKRNIGPFSYFMSLNVGKNKHTIKENDYIVIPKLSPLDIIKIKLSEDKPIELLTTDHPNINYDIIDESITRTINMFSKSKPAKFNKCKHKMPKWITKRIIRSLNIRNVMYRKIRTNNPDSEHYHTRKTNFRAYIVILKRSIYIAKKQYYQSCFDKYRNDMKQTWSTINTILNTNNTKRKLPEHFYLNGLLTNNTNNIVNSCN